MSRRTIIESHDDPLIRVEVRKVIVQLYAILKPQDPMVSQPRHSGWGGEILVNRLTDLVKLFWNNDRIPQDFKDAKIFHLYKNKASCNNHRGISLMSITEKI